MISTCPGLVSLILYISSLNCITIDLGLHFKGTVALVSIEHLPAEHDSPSSHPIHLNLPPSMAMDASFSGFRNTRRCVIHGNRRTTTASTLNRKTIPNTLCCLFDDSEGKVFLKLEKHTVFWCFEMTETDT